jgi:hypothetical protein
VKVVCCLEEVGERPEEPVRDGGATVDFDDIMDHGASGITQASV